MSEFQNINEWDKDSAKRTAELRKRMRPNIDLKDFGENIPDVLKRHIQDGRVAHVALFITFQDGGNKYFCAAAEDKPSSLIV